MEPPRDRLSRLSEASLRINETLEFDDVLHEVVESARSLTGARYGMMATLNESGDPEHFFSSGTTAEEHHQLEETPGGVLFFEHIRGIPEPMRVSDFRSYFQSMGLTKLRPPWPVGAFLAAPIRHQRRDVGNIYLAKEPGEPAFTREDEETLVLFASQAALVIANARRYRDEQRARARLETLIDTSPVGVAVFDARTGAPLSFNREALRIMESLRAPDQSPEQLLEVLSYRRTDGRRIAPFDIVKELIEGDSVRAEEIVIEVPDGRSVTTLVNGTPIRSADGEVESCVVTLQDMTALNELEKMRAEFLGMVRHELRAPLTSIKGSVDTMLESFYSLDSAEMLQFIRIIKSQSERMRDLSATCWTWPASRRACCR